MKNTRRIFFKHDILTEEEEVRLVEKSKAGDIGARNLLVESNMRLVFSIAVKFTTPNLEFEDLLQEGSLAIMRALETYDVKKGARFATYASLWIREYLFVAKNQSAIVTVARRVKAKAFQEFATNRPFLQNRMPQDIADEEGSAHLESQVHDKDDLVATELVNGTDDAADHEEDTDGHAEESDAEREKARELRAFNDTRQKRKPSERYLWAMAAMRTPRSLDMKLLQDADEDSDSLMDTLVDTAMRIDESLYRQQRNQAVHKAIDRLPKNWQDVLREHYGLGDDDPKTFREVGAALGYSHNNAYNLHKKAIAKLTRDPGIRAARDEAENDYEDPAFTPG